MFARARNSLLLLVAMAFAAWYVALAIGSVAIGPDGLWRALFTSDVSLARDIVLRLRLPRSVAAFATGALLATAGTLMQVLLRNPLADPYVLGISGGAAVGALAVIWLGWGSGWMEAAAFAGAMLSLAIVFGLARDRGDWTPTRLLLTGVIVAAGWGALITFILALAPETKLRGMLFWLMGDLSAPVTPWPAAALAVIGVAAVIPFARDFNVLARGELTAASLGVNIRFLRTYIFLAASLLTAVAVTTAGSIGFVGLVVPHLLRLAGIGDMRTLLPGAALAGGTLVLLAYTLARTAIAPQQLPVGVITAFIGVPVFLYLLRRR
jgi:iron complex transport system permease protein